MSELEGSLAGREGLYKPGQVRHGSMSEWEVRLQQLDLRLSEQLQQLRAGCELMWHKVLALEEERATSAGEATHHGQPSGSAALDAALVALWHRAPLLLRVTFLREMAEKSSPQSAALEEAAALLERWQSPVEAGEGLAGWVAAYPALFLEAWRRLAGGTAETDPGASCPLARATLSEVEVLMSGTLRAAGFQWIEPRPGDALTDGLAVAGEEPAPGLHPGSVARCVVPGLQRGRLVLVPAQVTRVASGDARARRAEATQAVASSGEAEPASAVPPRPAAPAPSGEGASPKDAPRGPAEPFPDLAGLPDWLSALTRRAAASGAHVEATRALVELARLPAGVELERLAHLARAMLPPTGLGAWEDAPPAWKEAWRNYESERVAWLRDTHGLERVAPPEGADFVAGPMEAVGARRTAHSHEHGRVARLERPGYLYRGQPLVPAQVVVYEIGDPA